MESYASYLNIAIPIELRKYVVAVIHGQSKEEVNVTFPAHPTGFSVFINVYATLPIVYKNDKKMDTESTLLIAGQLCSEDVRVSVNGMFGQIGLVLYPTATYYLLHKPGNYFLNNLSTLTPLIPFDDSKLMHSLSKTKFPEERVPILFEFLKRLVKTSKPPILWLDHALATILEKNGNVSQTELIDGSGISNRHFRRVFKEVIGLTPKYFCKVIQLNTVFELLKSDDPEKIHHLALDCGYYDQSHFINDFNKLIGESPENFLNGKNSFIKTYLGRRV